MAPELLYLVKMLVCSTLLFGYYRLVLYNERFHQWNRFYLLAALVLSVFLPLVQIPVLVHQQPAAMVLVLETLPWSTNMPASKPTWDSFDLLTLLVAIVSVIMLLRLLIGIIKLVNTFAKGPVTQLDSLKVVLTSMPEAPFSFFSWLFWRKDLNPHTDSGKRMLQHELTHIREGHSLDKLLVELVLIVFWINPVFWLIKRELNLIHEFLADRKAIDKADGAAFAAMILQASHPLPSPTLSNPFFSSQIKRRLQMITTSKKPKYSYLRRISGLLTMSLVGLALIFSLEKTNAQKAPPPPPAPPPPTQVSDSILTVNIQQTAKDSLVIFGMKDGRQLKMSPKQAREKGYPYLPPAPPAPPAPASGVAAPAPAASPVPAAPGVSPVPPTPPAPPKITIKSGSNLLQAGANEKQIFGDGAQPIIYLDGKEISQEEMQLINPENIATISVYKDESAITKYGGKAKSGVIEIISKPVLMVAGQPAEVSGKKAGAVENVRIAKGQPANKHSLTADEITVTGYQSKKADGSNNANTPVTVVGYGVTKAGAKPAASESKENILKIVNAENPSGNDPVYILVNAKTGARTIDKTTLEALDPAKISSVNVLKGGHATEKYGKDGKNGVIEITLK